MADEKREVQRYTGYPIIILLSTVIATILAIAAMIDVLSGSTPTAASNQEQITTLRDQLSAIDQRLTTLEETIANAGTLNTDVQVAQNQANITVIDTRLARFEESLSQDPARALEIPLLRRDIEDVRTDTIDQINTIETQNERILGLGQWLIGTIGLGILVALLTISAMLWSNRQQSRNEDNESASKDASGVAGN